MIPISAMKPGAVALTALALGGCYYTSPYGYAPYYAPVPAPLSQREAPAIASGNAVADPYDSAGTLPADALPPPAPIYAAPYPYYYPAYYPGWYGWGWPPVSIGFGFRGGGWGGGHWHGRGRGYWGVWGGHWGGGGGHVGHRR